MQLRKTLISTLVLGVFAVARLEAQTVRGTVVDQTNRPVAGVVLFLVDSASNIVSRALTNDQGAFRLGASRAGTYRVRTMRIGYKPITSDAMRLVAGGEVAPRIVLSGVQFQLDTVRVVDKSSCRVSSDAEAAATFNVLEQARTALSAAQLTLAGRTISATTLSYDRTLDADGRGVVSQSSRIRTDYVAQPWRALSPDSVHRAGFVIVERDNSVEYHAPSIDVLLSPVFLEDHCFRLVNDRGKPTLLGVGFTPSPDRHGTPEIRGVLWLDRKTAELRRLDYWYANVSAAQEDAGAGGSLDFARLTNGGWAISRWNIRMPVLQEIARVQALGGTQTHVTAIQVAGGELSLATAARGSRRDTLYKRSPLSMAGVVVDSASGSSVANAEVELAGTGLKGRSDASGHFEIAGVLPGTYTAETRTPELSAFGAASQSTIVFDDSTKSYQIRVPTAAQLASSICPAKSLDAGDAAILGRVSQRGDSTPASGSKVVAEWTVTTTQPGRGNELVRETRRVEGRAGADGVFRLCGVPMNASISLSASAAATTSEVKELRVASRITRVDLVVDRADEGGVMFAGTVLVDSVHTPIAGATVSIPDVGKAAVTDANGSFRIRGVIPGEHRVTVRRLGYGPLDADMTFADRRIVNRTIYLAHVVTLDSVVVQSTSLIRQLADFEQNRKLGLGKFWTRDSLAKLEGRPLASVLGDVNGAAIIKGHGTHAWITATRGGKSIGAMTALPGSTYGVDQMDLLNGAVDATCYASVWVDGVRVYRPRKGGSQPLFDLSSIAVDQIETIEYYAGPAQTPARYNDLDATCGVLVINTRKSP